MSAWIVYSKDGTTERCRLKKLEYSGSFMNERTVTATFEYESEVAFDVFDYIEYRGEKFELESIPTVKKTSSFSYEYELRFVSYKYELERCEMRDIVPNDNRVVYPTPLSFSFTGDVAYLAERIQANLDALYGTGVWSIIVAEGVTSEDKNITISQQNCWNALSLVNTTYELDFTVKGRTVTIGGNKPSVNHVFQYGKGKGLYEIERSADTETGIVTKLRAYGSERNLDYSYPKKPEWSDSALDTSFVLSPLRLMLPSFKEDGKTDYILADEATIAEYGIREASVIYDDIYPTITGVKNLQGQAIDEIKAVEAVDDTKSTFVIHLHDLGFDLESHLTTADAQISMKSGAMQGYTFNISAIEKQEDNSYKITLGRITTDTSDTGNYEIPNSSWNMAAGDKFVLLNILMPQEYIREAENRLLERAKEYLAEYGKTNFSYNVGLHDKFLVENSDVYSSLVEGAKLTIHDEVLGISEDVTIQSITITENAEDNILPQVKITLNNNPSASTLDRIQGQIKELSETASGNFSSQSELLKQYRKKLDKPFFDRLFVAVGMDGKELASTDTTSPIAYIKAKYSFATIGGITMYAQDGNIYIPTIAEGLPFDNRTIWYNTATKQIEVIGGTGGGSGEGVSNFWDLSGIPSWITNTKPTYSYSEIQGTPDLSVYALVSQIPSLEGYAKLTDIPSLSGYATEQWVLGKGYALSSDLSKYIPIAGVTDITGEKNFTGGLKVNGSPIYYDTEKKYWKLEGDLLVTGGVTMYGNDSEFVASTIMDAIVVDGTTISKEGGILKVIGSVGGATTLGSLTNVGSWADSVASQDRIMYQAANSSQWVAKNLSDLTVGGVTGDYLPLSGGELSGSLAVTAIQNGYWAGGIRIDGTTEKPPSLAFHIANLAGWRLYMDKNQKLLWENSSNGQGVTSREILHTSNYSSYALPLSGGTITSNSAVPLTINANNDGQVGLFLQSKGNNKTYIGWDSSRGTCLYEFASDSSLNILNGVPRFNTNTLWHAGNFTPSNYLPLSGGTLTGTLAVINEGVSLCLYRQQNNATPYIRFAKNATTQYGELGVYNDGRLVFWPLVSSQGGYGQWNTVWHAGNDGSGSGLDADLLDGKHLSHIIRYEGRNDNGNDAASAQTITYWGEGNWGHGYTYGTSLNIQGADSWNHRLDFRTDGVLDYYQGINTRAMTHIGTIAFTSSNVASATKLATARTIWGQSFDGTGNVSGDLIGSRFSGTLFASGFNDTWSDGTNSHVWYGYDHRYPNTGVYSTTITDYFGLTLKTASGNISMTQDGNVGIGTTNPREKLEVSNYALIGGNIIVGGGAIGFNRNTYQGGRYDTQKQGWQIDIGNNTLNFFTEGSLGTGNKVIFDASGNILATGGVTMYSDARKKIILNHVELSLQQVANAPLIEHYYNSDQNKTTHVGSIAQYWAEMNDWFCKKDSEGFYTMEIQNAALASAISVARELVKFEDETDRRIRLLEEENKRLKEEVEQLKWNIA